MRGFHDLLKQKPSSLFILLGWSSISIVSLIMRSMYLGLVERMVVFCSWMRCPKLMLCLPPAYLLVLAEMISSTLTMEAICSSETSVQLNRLHGVTSQKMILFITTAVKTSNSTILILLISDFLFLHRCYVSNIGLLCPLDNTGCPFGHRTTA
jgi:hypothetical protein